jgi:hypothetical protein
VFLDRLTLRPRAVLQFIEELQPTFHPPSLKYSYRLNKAQSSIVNLYRSRTTSGLLE